jgi:putative membrane protein
MYSNSLLSLVFASATISGFACLAQTQQPGMPMGQPPGGIPRTTNPMDPAGYPPDATRNDQRMENKIDEKRFVKDALLGGMTEVELGKVALEKASGDAVKQFAQKMIDDHTKTNEELKQLAAKESIDVPDALDSKRQSRIDKISKLSGADFDRAYIKDQVKDHQNDVREFQAEAQGGNDPGVKGFASKTLPVLEEHLRMVKELDKSKKATASR